MSPSQQSCRHLVDMRYSSRTIAGPASFGHYCAGGRAVYKLVRTSRLYEQIVQQIEASIVKGELKAGDQLPAERELAQRFGVSRTAVREAVKALREKGLVEAYSGRGTFITDGTTQAVRQSLDLMAKIGQPEGSTHLAEVRAILEPEIAGLAAMRIQEPELATMREAVAAMDRAGRNPETYIEAIWIFILRWQKARRIRSSFPCWILSSDSCASSGCEFSEFLAARARSASSQANSGCDRAARRGECAKRHARAPPASTRRQSGVACETRSGQDESQLEGFHSLQELHLSSLKRFGNFRLEKYRF